MAASCWVSFQRLTNSPRNFSNSRSNPQYIDYDFHHLQVLLGYFRLFIAVILLPSTIVSKWNGQSSSAASSSKAFKPHTLKWLSISASPWNFPNLVTTLSILVIGRYCNTIPLHTNSFLLLLKWNSIYGVCWMDQVPPLCYPLTLSLIKITGDSIMDTQSNSST